MKKVLIPGVIISTLSISLFAATQDSDIENRFSSLDKNGDGVITQEEARGSGILDNFEKFDANGDGQITKTEFSDFVLGQRKKLASSVSSEDDTLNPPTKGDNTSNRVLDVVANNEFEMMDKNGDGKVSKKEAAAVGISDTFSDMDINNDGFISAKEYAKHRKANYVEE